MIKNIWVDPENFPPIGYIWCKSVNITIGVIEWLNKNNADVGIIDIALSAKDYIRDGGDYDHIIEYIHKNNIKYNEILRH